MAIGGEPLRLASTPEQIRDLLASAGSEGEEDHGPAELKACYIAKSRNDQQIAGGDVRYLIAVKVR